MSTGFKSWQVIVIAGLCVSPFWLLASNLGDFSEARSTGLGMAAAGATAAIFKGLERLK